MDALTISGRVDESGRFLHGDKQKLADYLKQCAGRMVTFTVRPKGEKRTLDQNAYWWAEPVPRLAKELGYSRSQMSHVLLGECFGYSAGPLGREVPNKPSTTELTVAEFSELIEWVVIWANDEMNCPVMPPQTWQERQEAAECR